MYRVFLLHSNKPFTHTQPVCWRHLPPPPVSALRNIHTHTADRCTNVHTTTPHKESIDTAQWRTLPASATDTVGWLADRAKGEKRCEFGNAFYILCYYSRLEFHREMILYPIERRHFQVKSHINEKLIEHSWKRLYTLEFKVGSYLPNYIRKG